ISDYGTGTVMIAPFFLKEAAYFTLKKGSPLAKKNSEHEIKQNQEIDFAFSNKYQLPIKGIGFSHSKIFYSKYNDIALYSQIKREEFIEIINRELEKKGVGKKTEMYHLKDWIFSRQRYWGEPIPVIHWENRQKELVSEKDLPLILPPLTDFAPNPNYYAPLQKAENWINVEKNGLKGKRDTNVMPQWAGSCWYYIAFLLRKKTGYLPLNSPEAQKILQEWLPVDIYVGGQEHANLHYLYARFWHKILAKIGIVSWPEPFQKLICQGMILGADGEKMSKSRGNVVNPNELVELYGADALRLYEIFLGPTEHTANFDINTIRAMKKWLDRVYNFFLNYREAILADIDNSEIEKAYSKMVKEVSIYYQQGKLNVIVACLMVFINQCYKAEVKSMRTEYFLGFLKLLSPLAPHISEEMWNYFEKVSISKSSWPQVKENLLDTSQVKMAIQINGQKKTIILADKDMSQQEIEKLAKNDPKINEILAGKKVKRIIFLKNKLINFVF
ncbi:MAG: class I tRNA ligase family protein, partial [Candidatus Moeniiplasma glomeromycotorum]|nr:class I tRNA ligase family protein [Candidatus Moeniiplasma glomeromycotorum]